MEHNKLLAGVLVVLAAGLITPALAQQPEKVTIVSNSKTSLSESVHNTVSEIKEAVNRSGSWTDFELTGDHPGIGLLNQLVDKYGISTLDTATDLYLLKERNELFQARNLIIKKASAASKIHGELLLSFNREGQLVNASLAPPEHNYQQILEHNLPPTQAQKQQVLQVVEQFRLATEQGDTASMQNLLSPKAHIISGSNRHYYEKDSARADYWYVKTTRAEYINRLQRETFQYTNKLTVGYNDIRIHRSADMDQVFAVTLEQIWRSPLYSDTGYLAMVVDLQGEPVIRARVWRKNPFDVELPIVEGVPMSNVPHYSLASVTSDPFYFQTVDHSSSPAKNTDPGFFRSRKRLILITAAATSAVTLGVALITGGGQTELPDPPGRPGFK